MTDRLTFASTITAEGRRLRGSVQLAGQRTSRNGEYVEVDPAALVKADASKAVFSIGHQEGSDLHGYDPLRVTARADNGSLRLNRHETGFDFETDELPNTTYANDLLALADAKLLGGFSFEIGGLRSSFSTDPDGTRVRRYTSIAVFSAVNPVIDPAFPSSLAAFSKESEVTEIIGEPVAAPVITPAPVVDDKSDTYRTAEAFARKQDLASLEAAMENIVTGDMTPAKSEAYDAFSAVYDERKRADSEAKERHERIKLAQDLRLGRVPKAPVSSELFASADYLHAFNRYLRGGDKSVMEQFAQSIAGDGTQGGYLVPDSFLTKITERQVAYGGIRRVAEVISTGDGRTLPWPTNDDTSNSAAVVAEATAGTAGADLVFGTVSLGAFSYSSNGTGNIPLKVNRELLQDAAFDVESFVSRKLGERIGRKQAVDLATGAGTTLPFGALAKTPDTLTATKTRAAAIEMEFHIDSAYRESGSCVFVMSDTVLALYRNAVDLNGRPLWQANSESGMTTRPGGTLNGYPVIVDAAAGTLVAFGDLGQGYIIRDVKGVEVLVNPYSYDSTRQIGYSAWARMDANVQDGYAYSVADFASVTADATA
jgi:HK97 family phage major capsid protein